jgi:hypothetical protein
MTRVILLGWAVVMSGMVAAADKKTATEAEQKVIELVKKAGGKAAVDDELGDKGRVAVTFEKTDDAALLKLAKSEAIGAVEIRDSKKVSDRGFAVLKHLPNLKKVVIAGGVIQPTEAKEIGQLKSLEVLHLGGSKIGDSELSYLKGMAGLKMLDLMDSPITDAGLKTVLELTALEQLNLSGTKVTDAGAKKLLGLEKLKVVQLNNSKVTRGGVDAMTDVLKASKRELIVRW